VRSIVTALSTVVRRAPIAVVLMAVMATVVLAWFAQDVEQTVGNEGFAPDNPELNAVETIADRFGGSDEAVMQVLVEVDGGVVGERGVETVRTIASALEDSDASEHLAAQPERPAVVSPLLAVEQAAAEAGITELDDATVRELFSRSAAELPPNEAAFVSGLLPEGTDLADPAADRALVVVFLDPPGVNGDSTAEFDAVIDVQTEVADAVRSADLPGGATAEPFAFELLFADTGSFEAELTRLFGTAFGIILVILAFVYWVRPSGRMTAPRSARRAAADVSLTLATILMAVMWMNGAAALLGPGYLGVIGGLTEITQVLPVLLIGLGVDYGIHLTSRYREEVAGAPVAASVAGAVRTVGIALALATMTTAVGFLTNIVNPVPALRDFGVLAAIGIASSFLLMMTFVPATRLLLDRRAQRAGRLPDTELGTTSERLLPQLMARVAILAQRAAVPTLLVTVLLGGGLGLYGLSQLETRFSFTDFVPEGSPLVATFDEIEEDFGGGFGEHTRVLLDGAVARPQAHNALVEAQDRLGALDDVPTVDGQAPASSPVSLLAQLLAPGPDGEPLAPPVAAAAADAGVGPDLTVTADADVQGLYEAMWDAAPELAETVLARDAAGAFDLALVDVRTTAGEQGAGELADGFDEAFAPVEASGVEAIATSNEIINERIIGALSDSQMSSLVITLGAALVLLVVTFAVEARRPALGVLTIAPVGLVVLWTFGAMAATGIPFGPVTATIAALAIGIGVPYTIHVTNRFREDRTRMPLDAAIASTVRHTGGALAGSAFTTVAGFGVLVTSSLTPFRQFGLVTAYAIGFALIAATLVLPSLLVLWDRYHRARGRDTGFGYTPRHTRRPHMGATGEPVREPERA
jgi:uncharacterized protein